MGSQNGTLTLGNNQPNQPTQVYYDPEKQEYFSYKPAENSNPLFNALGIRGQSSPEDRIYLGNPYSTVNKYQSDYKPAAAGINDLFPALNTGLLQAATNQPLDTTEGAGAGRFLGLGNLLGNSASQNK